MGVLVSLPSTRSVGGVHARLNAVYLNCLGSYALFARATRGAPQRDALADEGRREQVLGLAHVHPRRGRSAGWVIGGQ